MTGYCARFRPPAGAAIAFLLALGGVLYADNDLAAAAPSLPSAARVTSSASATELAALVFSNKGQPRATLYMPSEEDLARSAARLSEDLPELASRWSLLRAFRDRYDLSDFPPPSNAHHGAAIWEETTWDGAPAIRATLVFDDPRTTITLTIYQNANPELPASHMAEIHFSDPFEPTGIELLSRLRVKALGQDHGCSLAAHAVAVTEDLFWIALSDDQDSITRTCNCSAPAPRSRFRSGSEAAPMPCSASRKALPAPASSTWSCSGGLSSPR